MKTIEPFGFFKPEPFGWTDCAEMDDDAIPLYDKAAIRFIQKERDELLEDAEKIHAGLENCRLFAARNRKEDWALLILGFCAEAGVVGSVTR